MCMLLVLSQGASFALTGLRFELQNDLSCGNGRLGGSELLRKIKLDRADTTLSIKMLCVTSPKQDLGATVSTFLAEKQLFFGIGRVFEAVAPS